MFKPLFKPNLKPFRVSNKGVETKPETLSGFKRGGLNQTCNPVGFHKEYRANLKPFRVSERGVQTKPETLSGFKGRVKPNPKPCGVSGGVYTQLETLSGFKRGGLNQTRNPFGCRVSERGFKPNLKPFRISNGGFKPNPKPFGVSSVRKRV